MSILVTGKNGQVGQALLRSLAGLDDIIALDRSQLDLADLDAVRCCCFGVHGDTAWRDNPLAVTVRSR